MVRKLAFRWASIKVARYAAILGMDAIATVLALLAAMFLRLDADGAARYGGPLRVAIPILVAARLLTIVGAKLHRWSFRMSGMAEALRLGLAMVAGSCLFLAVFSRFSTPLPRAVYVMEFFFTWTLTGAFRYAPRVAHAWYSEQYRRWNGLRTIIVGAGVAGDLLARDIAQSAKGRYFVYGFVDDDPGKLGSIITGKPVLGNISDLPRIIRERRIGKVLLAIRALPAARIREILVHCAATKARFKIMPGSMAGLDRRVSAAMLHDLSADDLLPRDVVGFDPAEIRAVVEGRRALVTGAGGSIGGEICRQLAAYGVAQLVMLDMNENELYLGARRLGEEHPTLDVRAEVADIRDFARLESLALRYRPQHVFHAAAHKHVPLMEDAPEEAVKNNVFGSLNVARMAHECGAERLVVISTDKAVRPTSVMGATKRIAELAVRDLARRSQTAMTAVRFGNVLGSAGSVVPIFKGQIERGMPITVTHPECTRYFMTIPEAVGLVLLAGLGGYGELCVLDMGEPIKIVDLAANLIAMAGRSTVDIPIIFTGLRPGEKLYEELMTEEEEQTQQVRNKILVAKSPPPPSDLHERLRELERVAASGDRERILVCVEGLVPTYRRTTGQAANHSASMAPRAAWSTGP